MVTTDARSGIELFFLTFEKPQLNRMILVPPQRPLCLPRPSALIEGERKKKTFVVLGVGVAPCFLLAWVCSSVSVFRPYCNFSFYHMTCHVQPHRVVTKGFLLHANKGISLPHVGMQNACVSSIKANIFIGLQNISFLYCYPSRHLPHLCVDIIAFVLLVVHFQVCMSFP